jgi:hypothetical protein
MATNMKTFGLLETQTLMTLPTNADGEPILDDLRPDDADENWQPPDVVPLVKLSAPDLTADETAEPTLIWHNDRVERDWLVRAKTAEELAAEARKIWPTVADFWSEFLAPEKLAIAISTHEGVILLREELRMWRGEIWSDSPHVTDGLAGLVALGILTQQRQTEILT